MTTKSLLETELIYLTEEDSSVTTTVGVANTTRLSKGSTGPIAQILCTSVSLPRSVLGCDHGRPRTVRGPVGT
jgi:hypothetical protein